MRDFVLPYGVTEGLYRTTASFRDGDRRKLPVVVSRKLLGEFRGKPGLHFYERVVVRQRRFFRVPPPADSRQACVAEIIGFDLVSLIILI